MNQFEEKIALKVFGLWSKGRRAGRKKVEDVLRPVAIASISVRRVNLSVARRLFDGGVFAESFVSGRSQASLTLFLASKSGFSTTSFSQFERTIPLKVYFVQREEQPVKRSKMFCLLLQAHLLQLSLGRIPCHSFAVGLVQGGSLLLVMKGSLSSKREIDDRVRLG